MIRVRVSVIVSLALLLLGLAVAPATAECGADGGTGMDHFVVGMTCDESNTVAGDGSGEVPLTMPLSCDEFDCQQNSSVACPPGEEYYILWAQATDGSNYIYRQGCYGPRTSAVTDELVLEAIRRVGLPTLLVSTTPPDRTLVNLKTVFFTSPTSVTRTLTLLGQSVEVDATPARYLWHFGDGQSASTDSPGSPYPAMDLTHRYLKVDTVRPSVDTTYTARFRVNGGAWQDVNGTVTIVGPPITLEVLEATPVLSGNR